jgi:hypothetical protein
VYRKLWLGACYLALFCALGCPALCAQSASIYASIVGTVNDPSGAAVLDASVTRSDGVRIGGEKRRTGEKESQDSNPCACKAVGLRRAEQICIVSVVGKHWKERTPLMAEKAGVLLSKTAQRRPRHWGVCLRATMAMFRSP